MFKITARTILELGAELISSDIIAFYELIKNAIDAKSKSGAEIEFRVVLRRNDYLRLDQAATAAMRSDLSRSERKRAEATRLAELQAEVANSLNISGGSEAVREFKALLAGATDLQEFVQRMCEGYRKFNTIEIRDSGTGMSATQLSENYLTIGTPSRKREVDQAIAAGETKTPYLGEKGIGRLSAMRLGDRLRVETARTQDAHLSVLEIDWNQFSDIDAMVEDIDLAVVRGPRKESPVWTGTRLTIGGLSEDWTERRVREHAEYDFARLTDPFADPKKRPRVALHWNGTRVAIPWMDRVLLENAHASFAGNYAIKNGKPELRFRMEAIKLGYTHPREVEDVTLLLPDLEGLLVGTSEELPLEALTSVGPFTFEGYWYNRRSLSGIEGYGNQKAVRDLQTKWSGILLYRDGFRVFPYGEDEDDWLGLDRKALGRSSYVLNKAQFVGHVQITRTGNPGLIDQTNREGLRSTPEQRVLISVLQHVVRDALWNFFREVDRRYKKAPLDLVDVHAQVEELEKRAKTALSKVGKLVPKDQAESVEELREAFTEFRALASRAQQRITEVEAEGREMVQMAGVGLMVEVVAHELARATESALESLELLRGRDVPADFRAKLETLRAEMKTVSKRLRVLDELSVSGRQRKEVFDLGALIDDLLEGHQAQFARHKLNVAWKKPSSPVRIQVVKGMIVQILENLISNSIYWLKMRRSSEADFQPRITIQLETDPVRISFSDNGRGVDPEHQERVFRPFWSLKEKGKRRGLGLYIARENATYLGGQLILSDDRDPELGRLHEFVLNLPKAAQVR